MEMTFFKAVNPQIQAANFSYSNPGNPISVLWVKEKKKQWKSWLLNNNKEPHSYIGFQLLLPIIAAASLKAWTKLNNIFHCKSVNCNWLSFLVNLFPLPEESSEEEELHYFSRNDSKTKP